MPMPINVLEARLDALDESILSGHDIVSSDGYSVKNRPIDEQLKAREYCLMLLKEAEEREADS